MSLVEELKRHLKRVRAGYRRAPDATRQLALLRAHTFAALERLEAEVEGDDEAREAQVRAAHAALQDGTRFEAFVDAAEGLLAEGLCAGGDAQQMTQALQDVINQRIGLTRTAGSIVRALEIERVSSAAWKLAERPPRGGTVDAYARELRLTSVGPEADSLTPLGATLLDLVGRDAVAWILLLEVRQTTGSQDPWRVGVEALAWILQQLKWTQVYWGDEPWSERFAWQGQQRLVDLGVLREEAQLGEREYSFEATFAEVLRDIVEARPTPLSLLADSLLNETRDAIAGGVRATERSAEVYARHARMVVHEIRNALLPVDNALRSLYRELEGRGVDVQAMGQRARIERGIERVFAFVGEMQKVADLDRPAEPFDPWAALADARASLNGGVSMDLAVSPEGATFRLLGHRARFTHVFANLLRNAAQSSARARVTVRVAFAFAADGERALIVVEDDGPGVPEAHRGEVFERGFSLRSGGSGQGLALVREVIEVEMGGQVRCEAGSEGGARFVMTLPPGRCMR